MDDATYRAVRDGRRRRRADRARVRLRRRPRGRGRALELLPRHRPHAHRDDGLARRPRAASPGRRHMVDAEEWDWIERWTRGDVRPPAPRHLAARVPRPRHALPRGLERGGLRGRVGPHRGAGRREASAAPSTSSTGPRSGTRCATSRTCSSGSRAAGTGETAPGSVVLLSGDVHHAYLARAEFASGNGGRSPVYQAVCSPLRNPLNSHERRAIRIGMSRGAERVGRALARAAGVARGIARLDDRGGAVVRQPGRDARARRPPRMDGPGQDREPAGRPAAPRAGDATATVLTLAKRVVSPDGGEDGRRERRRCRPCAA